MPPFLVSIVIVIHPFITPLSPLPCCLTALIHIFHCRVHLPCLLCLHRYKADILPTGARPPAPPPPPTTTDITSSSTTLAKTKQFGLTSTTLLASTKQYASNTAQLGLLPNTTPLGQASTSTTQAVLPYPATTATAISSDPVQGNDTADSLPTAAVTSQVTPLLHSIRIYTYPLIHAYTYIVVFIIHILFNRSAVLSDPWPCMCGYPPPIHIHTS